VTGNHVQDEWRAPLDDLRTLRESLREEEQRVSLAAARPRDGARRRSPAATSLALEGLVEAEVKLSAYRRALHERIDACTAQLVDHYQRDPAQIVR